MHFYAGNPFNPALLAFTNGFSFDLSHISWEISHEERITDCKVANVNFKPLEINKINRDWFFQYQCKENLYDVNINFWRSIRTTWAPDWYIGYNGSRSKLLLSITCAMEQCNHKKTTFNWNIFSTEFSIKYAIDLINESYSKNHLWMFLEPLTWITSLSNKKMKFYGVNGKQICSPIISQNNHT